MDVPLECPECGASYDDGKTCQDRFHQMLLWEWEDPGNLIVHHLMVLSYHLQHPGLYSPEGLAGARQLLLEAVKYGVSADELRRRHRAEVDSGKREFKIKGTPSSHGSYSPPVRWTMTTRDVIAVGIDGYTGSVETWSRSVLDALQASGYCTSP